MKTGTAIIAALGVGVGVTAYNYYKGAYSLKFEFNSLAIQGNQVMIQLRVINPSRFFTYPIPRLFFNVYDKAGNYFGVLYSSQAQWVSPGMGFVTAYTVPNLQAIVQSLAALIVPGANLELNLTGHITIGNRAIPVTIPINQSINF